MYFVGLTPNISYFTKKIIYGGTMGRRELEWISQHQEEMEGYSGMWIAVWEDEIISVGKTAKEVLEKAREKGIDKPHLTILPRKDEGMYVL